MRLPRFQYVEPRSIKEAADFLNDHGLESKIIAGGTDLLPSMKQQIFRPKYLLNLCSLPDLDRMEFEEGTGLRMGSRVVISAVGSRPEKVTAVRDLVSGKKLDGTLIGEAGELAFKAARPVANTASTPSYRKKMVKILVERALKQAAERAA